MLPQTPYTIEIDDLKVTVQHLWIDFPHLTPLSVFKGDADITAEIQGSYTDKNFQKSADITINVVAHDENVPINQSMSFSGNFIVERNCSMPVSYAGIRLGKHCYEVIRNYINEKPIVDKEGKLYPLVELKYSHFHFDRALFR